MSYGIENVAGQKPSFEIPLELLQEAHPPDLVNLSQTFFDLF